MEEAFTDVDGDSRKNAWKFPFRGRPLYVHGRFHWKLPPDFHSTSDTSILTSQKYHIDFRTFYFDLQNVQFRSQGEVLEVRMEVLEVEWKLNGSLVEAFNLLLYEDVDRSVAIGAVVL